MKKKSLPKDPRKEELPGLNLAKNKELEVETNLENRDKMINLKNQKKKSK